MPAAKQGGGTTGANIFKRLKSVLLLKFLPPGGASVTLCRKRDSSAMKLTSGLNFSRLRVFFEYSESFHDKFIMIMVLFLLILFFYSLNYYTLIYSFCYLLLISFIH